MDYLGSLEDFEDSDRKLSASVHFILIVNGFLLAAYYTIFSKGIPHSETTVSVFLMIVQSFPPQLYSAGLSGPVVENFLLALMHLAVVIPIFASIGFCIGVVNAGIWNRQRKSYWDSYELIEREDHALVLYSLAAKAMGFGVIGLYSVSLVPFIGGVGALIVWIGSAFFILYSYLSRKVFSAFY